jgi:hypothetical protein
MRRRLSRGPPVLLTRLSVKVDVEDVAVEVEAEWVDVVDADGVEETGREVDRGSLVVLWVGLLGLEFYLHIYGLEHNVNWDLHVRLWIIESPKIILLYGSWLKGMS